MDRSVDSIGSCSLDVDADSTDVSDTSGSLNFPTPISVKDVTREFTTNIRERCAAQNLHENNKTFGIEKNMVVKQPLGSVNNKSALLNSSIPQSNKIITSTDVSLDKKPSYLNLACCVNGYSNLTTYDSKIRQDINKSREVSPIRPSSNSIQYCKKSDSLTPPILLKMDDGCGDVSNGMFSSSNGQCNNFAYNKSEGDDSSFQKDRRNNSFIQQRVERLYGPAALAQHFYSPKKVRSSNFTYSPARDLNDASSSELVRKFQQLTPSKDYTEFRKKLSATTSNYSRQIVSSTDISRVNNNNVDLPVFRHLSQEFRAQLPLISPKKNHSRHSPNTTLSIENYTTGISQKDKVLIDEVDRQEVNVHADQISNKYSINEENTQKKLAEGPKTSDSMHTCAEKDGTYFLHLLRHEQSRLLALADRAEQYVNELSGNPDISEDTLGLLRSAYGKARLLVSQKMKQFEGLCQNNLNSSPNDKFPTTNDDLQGFWDMVNLQVDHINSIFDEINLLKENNWKFQKSDEIIHKEITKLSKIQPKSTKAPNQKMKSSTSNGNESKEKLSLSAGALKREAQRKMLQEMKRKNKIALSAKSTTSDFNSIEPSVDSLDTVEIFVKNSK